MLHLFADFRRRVFATGAVMLLAAFPVAPALSRASDATPLAVINNSPLTQIRAAPAPTAAAVAGAAETRFLLTVLRSNHFVNRSTASEILTLDGETTRVTLSAARGLGDGREVAMEIPFVSHAAGGLDRSIDKFHDTLGFPDGGRSDAPSNRLLFLYRRDGTDVLHITEPQSGLGDVRVNVGQQLLYGTAPGGWDATARIEAKFPTGDSDALLGSGGTDVAMSLSAACDDAECPLTLRWYGAAGAMYVGRGDILRRQVRPLVAFADIGVAWPWTESIVFKAQIDAQTALYRDSDIKAIKAPMFQFAAGASWRVSPGNTLDFAFTEDISVLTAPDISFLLTWRYDR